MTSWRLRFAFDAGHNELILSHDHLGADIDPVIQIDHIIVDKTKAARRDGLSYCLRGIGAVDAIDGIAEIHRGR
jgi:hypothetical protein